MSRVRDHALLGAEIVGELLPADQVLWVRNHHERWDGAGYPDGIGGGAISEGARIIAVADAWDVMTSDRPYRRALDPAHAEGELRRLSGVQFCPAAVTALCAILGAARAGAARALERAEMPASRRG